MEIVRMMLSAPSERQEIGKFTMSTSARHFCFVVIFSKNVTWITLRAKIYLGRVNSSVKLQTCARGSIVAGRAPFSRAKFQRKRKLGKGKLEPSNTNVDLPQCFAFYQKRYMLLKRRDLLAWGVVCNSCETT